MGTTDSTGCGSRILHAAIFSWSASDTSSSSSTTSTSLLFLFSTSFKSTTDQADSVKQSMKSPTTQFEHQQVIHNLSGAYPFPSDAQLERFLNTLDFSALFASLWLNNLHNMYIIIHLICHLILSYHISLMPRLQVELLCLSRVRSQWWHMLDKVSKHFPCAVCSHIVCKLISSHKCSHLSNSAARTAVFPLISAVNSSTSSMLPISPSESSNSPSYCCSVVSSKSLSLSFSKMIKLLS